MSPFPYAAGPLRSANAIWPAGKVISRDQQRSAYEKAKFPTAKRKLSWARFTWFCFLSVQAIPFALAERNATGVIRQTDQK